MGATFLFLFLVTCSTPLIMASGRELCYLLLTGILMCYLMAIPILAMPTVFTCSVLRLGLGFALCLCYSSILTKTNRISRIFNRGAKAGIKRPSYTSPKSQIVICCGTFISPFVIHIQHISLKVYNTLQVWLRCNLEEV